jgi:hypothetical protein
MIRILKIVMMKLFLFITEYTPNYDVWGNGGIAPPFLT